MAPIHRRFEGLTTVIDEFHDLCAKLERSPEVVSLDVVGVQVLKLVVHEWIANLVQHAAFGDRAPSIEVLMEPERSALRCIINDNSEGFDLAHQIARQQYLLDTAPEPPERGRGLLMMAACTQKLSYTPINAANDCGDDFPGDFLFRLEFRVASHDLDRDGHHRDRDRQIPFTTEQAIISASNPSFR